MRQQNSKQSNLNLKNLLEKNYPVGLLLLVMISARWLKNDQLRLYYVFNSEVKRSLRAKTERARLASRYTPIHILSALEKEFGERWMVVAKR